MARGLSGPAGSGDSGRPTPRSAELYARAVRLMPGGVNSPVRAMAAIGRDPIFIERAAGCTVTDVDGNDYIDWVCSWGPLILGHADPGVVAALTGAAGRGVSFGAATEGEVRIAAEVAARFEAVEMVRMVSSGTEAAMSAIRLARAATGRERLVKFAGAYHGHFDGLLAEAGSGLATHAIPSSPGVPVASAEATVVVPWNDRIAVEQAVDVNEPAAIICEPIPANMGVVPPDEGFVAFLRELADRHGALLICDEVISGFRVARGGAQELLGVAADLTILGKVIGGGLPAAAYGGSRELLERLAPAGDVYQAGTLAGTPLAVAAGLATLERLDAAAYDRIALLTARLEGALQAAIDDAAVAGRVCLSAAPGLLTLFFRAEPPHDFATAKGCDQDAYGRFCRAMLDRGVYPPPSQFEAWFVSLAHDEAAIERTAEAAAQSLRAALG